MRKKIPQYQARADRKRLLAFERLFDGMNRVYSREIIGGVHIATIEAETRAAGAVMAARRLGHCLIAVGQEGNNELKLMALPPQRP